jgi:Tol biopolymer transport system component
MHEPAAVGTDPHEPSLPPPPPASSGRPTTFGLRPIAVAGLCLLVAGVAAFFAYRTLWPWPKHHADEGLALFVALAGVIGLGAALFTASQRRQQAVTGAIVLAAAIPFVAVTFVPGIAQPRSSPLPGGQAYALYAAPDGNWDLYLLPHGDAAGLVALTTTDDVNERWPVLAPDGRSVIYTLVSRDGSMDLHRLQLQPDGLPGADEIVLPGDGKNVSANAFAPDGTLLVQVAEPGRGPSIDRLDLATGTLTPVLDRAYGAAYSPDGSQIAFTRRKPTAPLDWDVWVADADGHHARDVIDAEGTQDFPTWSPDGTRLAFSGSSPRGDPDVFVAHPDGSGVVDLTPDSRDSDTAQGWTPDGHVLFLSNRSHTGGTFLYFMNVDGTDAQLALRL